MQNFFDKKLIGDIEYTFEHLNPFQMSFWGEKVNKELKINVLFSDHCFTERSDKYKRSAERHFSQQRYELSKNLPTILLGMLDKRVKVYQTSARRNFAYAIKITENNQDYNIFFDLRKHNKLKDWDLNLRVESAYVFDDGVQLQHSGNIWFLILCQKIFLGEKIQCQK